MEAYTPLIFAKTFLKSIKSVSVPYRFFNWWFAEDSRTFMFVPVSNSYRKNKVLN